MEGQEEVQIINTVDLLIATLNLLGYHISPLGYKMFGETAYFIETGIWNEIWTTPAWRGVRVDLCNIAKRHGIKVRV